MDELEHLNKLNAEKLQLATASFELQKKIHAEELQHADALIERAAKRVKVARLSVDDDAASCLDKTESKSNQMQWSRNCYLRMEPFDLGYEDNEFVGFMITTKAEESKLYKSCAFCCDPFEPQFEPDGWDKIHTHSWGYDDDFGVGIELCFYMCDRCRDTDIGQSMHKFIADGKAKQNMIVIRSAKSQGKFGRPHELDSVEQIQANSDSD
jgi:hypothetical protein